MLEDNAPERYYLSEKILQSFIKHTEECKEKGQGYAFIPNDGGGIARSVTTLAGNRMEDNFVVLSANKDENLKE